MRVVPRIAARDLELDYTVPAELDALVATGTIVRVVLAGRRVSGWVVGEQDDPDPKITLRPILAVTGHGPPKEVVELAGWAAWRWAGRRSKTLVAASPPRVVKHLPSRPGTGERRFGTQSGGPVREGCSAAPASPAAWRSLPAGEGDLDASLLRDILSSPRAVARIPPSVGDVSPYLHRLVRSWGPRGGIILSPSADGARRIAAALLREHSAPTALLPGQWAEAAAGGCVAVGARSAVWAPAPEIAGIVVLDAHDEAYVEERAPTWNAWMVAAERARRAGVGCTLISACPSLEMLQWGDLLTPSRSAEREGWPIVEVIDRRVEDPRSGLISHRLAGMLRDVLGGRSVVGGSADRSVVGGSADHGTQVVCVLNTRGWAALLACAACGELARCERCLAAVEVQGAPAGSESRTAHGTVPGTVSRAGGQGSGAEGGDQAAGAGPRQLTCRRCGTRRPVVCAACSSQRLKVLRSGVSRVGEQLEALTGTAVPVVTGEHDRQASSRAMRCSRVLVGTEAVLNRMVAEGRKVQAVVFLDFDRELLVPRVRASERAMMLLAKAARLAWARGQGGRILVQTRVPDHEVIAAAMRADPGRMVVAEARVRRELRFPPAWAVARISGPGAADFVAETQAGVSISQGKVAVVEAQGPGPDGWLLRARDHETLCNVLAHVPRLAARVRIEVDPIRL